MRKWWQWPSLKAKSANATLVFKSNESFFNMFCEFGATEICKGARIPALVLDARELAGAKNAIKTNKDGSQFAMIRVASPEGGWVTIADTASSNHTPLQPGDLVAWMPLELGPHSITADTRTTWLGLIIAKLHPEMGENGPKVAELF